MSIELGIGLTVLLIAVAFVAVFEYVDKKFERINWRMNDEFNAYCREKKAVNLRISNLELKVKEIKSTKIHEPDN